MARKTKNPSVSDIISNVVLGSAASKAKDHVVKYYKKKGRQMRRKRRNPDESPLATSHSNDVIPANEVAELVGGEYIPLKGMIVTDDSIQLISNAGERISNPGKAKLTRLLSKSKTTTRRRSNPSKSKFAQAKAELKALGIKLTKSYDGEYRVTPISGNKAKEERQAYYASDLADALGTGRQMARGR